MTGASSGIGLELAKQFADNGFDLLVNAEDTGIGPAAQSFEAGESRSNPSRPTCARPTASSASTRRSRPPDARWTRRRSTPESAAAARSSKTDLDDEQEIIDVNISSTVRLAKHVLRDMVARDDGRILITSSIASTMPGSYQAVYNASKSFLQSFAQAVQSELKDTGVTITSLMPGPTDTEFFERADMRTRRSDVGEGRSRAGREAGFRRADEGPRQARRRLGEDRSLQGVANKVLPDQAKAAAHRRMAEPGSGA